VRRPLIALLVGGVVLTGNTVIAAAITEHDPYTLIVKFADHIDGKALAQNHAQANTARVVQRRSLADGLGDLRPLFPIPPKGVKSQELYDSLQMGQYFVANWRQSPLTTAVIETLEGLPEIDLAELNYICRLVGSHLVPNDPLYLSQRHYEKIDLPQAWEITTGANHVTVGVLDSGADLLHPDLADRWAVNLPEYYGTPEVDDDGNGYIDDVHGYDFVNSEGSPADDRWHGTHVCGTIGASSDNSLGVAGVDWNCRLLLVKVMDKLGYSPTDIVSSGVFYAVNEGCHVINLSLSTLPTTVLETAITYAYRAGVVVVAAMGNDNTESENYPAFWSTTLAVGATDSLDNRWVAGSSRGSDFGDHICVVAPGKDIVSTYPLWHGGPYAYSTGTSMATPHVSGLAALILSVRPGLSADSLYYYICAGAEDQIGDPAEDTPGWDKYYGWGRINACNSLRLAMGQDPTGILETAESIVPAEFSLHQNYPNPFNTSTVIALQTASPGAVRLEIFNILGQEVLVREFEVQSPGLHRITWNGFDHAGKPVPSGLYFYRLVAGGHSATKKMVLLK